MIFTDRQRSCEKLMFSVVSVILFGGSLVQCPGPVNPYCTGLHLPDIFKFVSLGPHHTGSPPPPDMFKLVDYEAPTAGKREVGIPLNCLLVTVRNEVAKVMFLHLCVCPQRGCLPQCMRGYHPPPGSRHPPQSRPPPPLADGYCCGRYASYWNAFLFLKFSLPTIYFET